jgi:catechol 2,3-dioxygenase-like lactoylglutathione lyase family enzyme
MNWTLELIVVPVADIDRAKAFYRDQAGFSVDVDHSAGDDFRVVQLTPPGSACSIALLKDNPMAPGSLHGLHLCVEDVTVAREELLGRGVAASEPFHFGASGRTPGLDPDRRSYSTFLTFHDPDGNTWLVQEVHRAEAAA